MNKKRNYPSRAINSSRSHTEYTKQYGKAYYRIRPKLQKKSATKIESVINGLSWKKCGILRLCKITNVEIKKRMNGEKL